MSVVPNPKTVRCVLVGDGAVGKTTLILRYMLGELVQNYYPTVFQDYNAAVSVDGTNYELHIADTAGQEDYKRLRPLSYTPSPDVFLICFSIGSPFSFERVSTDWLPELRQTCPNVPILLVGTQFDLRSDSETIEKLAKSNTSPVSKTQGQQMAKELKAINYMECSAITKENVAEVFEEVVRIAINSEHPPILYKEAHCLCCILM